MLMLASVLLGLVVAILLIVPTINYRIGRRRLVFTVMGVPVRWVHLRNIRHVSDRPKGVAEPWGNTWNPGNRTLFIRKRRGLFRSIKVTPVKHFVFKHDLELAIRELTGKPTSEETVHYTRDAQGRVRMRPQEG